MAKKMTADEFKMLLLTSEDHEDYQSWEGFTHLMSGALNNDEQHCYSQPFFDEYFKIIEAGDLKKLASTMADHQLDNYILATLAAERLGVLKELPLVAYAASNKKMFPGWHGEVVNLRALLVFGFDADSQTMNGETALHAMCSLKWGSGIHEKAVDYLLAAGANPNVKNDNGDTALTYLAGSYPWTEEVHMTFAKLLDHGADPFEPSNDGKNALDVLKDVQSSQDESDARQSAIDLIELMGASPKPKQPRTAPRL